ncbi:MAG: ABC transporter permease [Gemmatimonadaceae bacterium]|nr:ABC transporter permease [Gemmatimonadaceae bacterium]
MPDDAGSAALPAPLRRIRSGLRRTPLDWAELWRYRDLWTTLAMRDVKLRYRQTALGAAWVVLLPLVASGIFTLVFGKVARLPSSGVPYFFLVFAGYLGWSSFQNTLLRCSIALIGNTTLVTKVYFPRLLLPASSVLASLLDFAVGMVIFLLAMGARGHFPSLTGLLLIPFLMLMLQVLSLGMGLFAAALTVRFRDVTYVLPILVQLLFFASPVGYSLDALAGSVPEWVRIVYLINPVAPMLDALRSSLLGTGDFHWKALALSSAVSVLMLAGGTMFFLFNDRQYADVI